MHFSSTEIQKEIQHILEGKVATKQDLKHIFSFLDLTSLKSTDNLSSIKALCKKVNVLQEHYADMPNVAALCVYPSMVEYVKRYLYKSDMRIASVSAGFPASQTFLSVKMAESELAVQKGAQDIDIVIALGAFLDKDYDYVAQEISLIKTAIADAHLKVILETALIPSLNDVYQASILAMQAGANFIKTSTGKENSVASLDSFYVMLKAIKKHYEQTGQRIGIKPAGGIVTTQEAFSYYCLVKTILGEDWLSPRYFRIGASRLANNLIKEIEHSESNYF